MAGNKVQDVELDDNAEMVEAHDPKNAEKQSIASVAAASKATGKAAARRGDKSNGEPMPKSKAGMISVAHDLMSEMTSEQLEGVLEVIMGENISEDKSYEAPRLMGRGSREGHAEKVRAAVLAHAKDKGYKVNHHDEPHSKPDITISYEHGDTPKDSVPSYYTVHSDGPSGAHKDKELHKILGGSKRQHNEDLDHYNFDFTSDLNALVESEGTLSEEFKSKTATIFEAAVKSKLSEEIDRLEEAYATELDEQVSSMKADLVEKVDSYLNYVVESWMEENQLAVRAGLRTEIAETFMTKLKDLFVESYVEVPESKVDLLDEVVTANEELEEQLNSTVARNIKLNEELEGYKRDAIIREASKDLAETQVVKLASLVEDIAFDDEKSFAQKVKTIKESYFKKKTAGSSLTEETDDMNSEEVSPVMAQYLKAIRKSN